MKILIIEGIATSGKSSLTKALSRALKGSTMFVFGEEKTHEPIMDKPNELHIDFFKSLLQDAQNTKSDFIIYDRFHFTQAFRACVGVEQYDEIEEILAQHKTLIVYLEVDESAISQRVQLASIHRDKSWATYIKSKGKTHEEIAAYYIEQQRYLIQQIYKTKLPVSIFNTTNHDYETIAVQIVKKIKD